MTQPKPLNMNTTTTTTTMPAWLASEIATRPHLTAVVKQLRKYCHQAVPPRFSKNGKLARPTGKQVRAARVMARATRQLGKHAAYCAATY